jgi:hypothetical protein
MGYIFEPAQVVQTETTGRDCEVEQFIGRFGQGEVYHARLGREAVVLKWYYQQQAMRERYEILERIVGDGPPSDRFLWPLELAHADGVAGFGETLPQV